MSIGQAFRLAMKSIIGNKMRSFLTMLGMIIGVAAVIALIGLTQGVKDYILQQFSDMGTNVISVSLWPTDTRSVSVDEIYDMVEENGDIFESVSPTVIAKYTAKKGSKSVVTSVNGVSEQYFDLKNFELSSGRFIQYSDIATRHNACVIGSYIVDELYGGKVKLGDSIKINGQMYTIVGIQKEEANSQKNSTDDCIYIPYNNATRLSSNAVVTEFSLGVKDPAYVTEAEKILDDFIFAIMKNKDFYYIMSMTALLKEVDTMMGVMSTVLSSIAGISLLVAGIGIMNIMLVSVVERTKEIGIRKSLGAKKKDIMRQFVIEAAAISSLGGGIGILIGAVSTTQLGKAFGVNAAPTLSSVLLAFGVSAAIGIGFGYLPANKAAKLNPIDALRSE
jgi:putative ABC transport system permease protein